VAQFLSFSTQSVESVTAVLMATSNSRAIDLQKGAPSAQEAAEALERALEFMSDVSGPPETDDEQRRITSTLHALDHATLLAEIAGEASFKTAK
jgi:phosphate:Na+ symporter